MSIFLKSIVPYLLILFLGFAIGYWFATGISPVIPDPIVKYIERPGLNVDRYFSDPPRLPDVPNYRFIIVERPEVEERIIRVPIEFPRHFGLIEDNAVRIRGRTVYLRHFDTETGQFRINQYEIARPNWNIGLNIDMLYPPALAANPYITWRGFGPTAWALIDAQGNGFWYAGLRMQLRF